jgi:hypothetical protein
VLAGRSRYGFCPSRFMTPGVLSPGPAWRQLTAVSASVSTGGKCGPACVLDHRPVDEVAEPALECPSGLAWGLPSLIFLA